VPIRLRLALVFTVATLLLLAVGGWAYWRDLGAGLNASLDTSLRTRAVALQTEVLQNDADDIRETGPGGLLGFGDTIAQVIRSTGQVLETSNGLPPKSLLSQAQLATAARGHLTLDTTITAAPSVGAKPNAYHVRLFAAPSGRPGEVVVVGANREVVDDALRRATHQLLLFGALVLLLGATGSYLLARAALRPVDLMRAQAADLNAQDAGAGLRIPKTRDEVSRLAVTMNALLGRLHEALARERAFVADAGHELRTPLTVLKGELELAGRPGRSANQLATTVTIAAAETDRLIRLSEGLLLLAQSEEGPFLHLNPVDVRAVACQAVDARRRHASGMGVHLATPVGCHVLVPADRDRIRQVLDNLLSNAVRFAPSGTTVSTTLETTPETTPGTTPGNDKGFVTVTVTDHGPGFPESFLPVAFERFRRADTSRSRDTARDCDASTSTGLGLAIVRTIARAHGGSVSASNNPGGGASVAFTLPLAEAAIRPPERVGP
jgi:two-component system, OmpR family, sensor kinase